MQMVTRGRLIHLGLVIALILGGLLHFPQMISAYWHNIGAIGVVTQLAASGTNVFDEFVKSERMNQNISDWEFPIAALQTAIRWYHDNPRSRYLLGTAFWFVGELDQISLLSHSTDCRRCTRNDLLMLLSGMALYQEGNVSEARRTWQLTPDLDVILVELGFRSLKNQERAKMYELWEVAEAVHPAPKLAKARMYKYMCGRSFRFQEWLEAEHWCRQWQSVQSSPSVDIMVAHALIGNKDLEGAKKLLDQVRRSPDASNPATMGQIFWLSGRIFAQQGQWQSAFDSFEHALELVPNNRFLYLHYAAALLDAGRLETAKIMLDEAEHLDDGTLAPQIAQLRSRIP